MSIFLKIILTFIIIFLQSCSLEKIDNVHGITNLQVKTKNIKLNSSNKNDVKNILGPAPITSENDKIWSYFEVRETRNKIGQKKIYKNDYVELLFNKYGVVEIINFYDLSNMKKIKYSENVTETMAIKNTILEGLLNSTRKRLKDLKNRMK